LPPDRTDEAIAQFRQALALKSDLATAWNNLGLSLQAANELPDAVAAFREALRAAPDFAQAHWNLALALLISGQYAEGWREYEWRHRAQTFGAAATSPAPRWQREALTVAPSSFPPSRVSAMRCNWCASRRRLLREARA
jgi:tetratricopeptide (TPR) repeat protein